MQFLTNKYIETTDSDANVREYDGTTTVEARYVIHAMSQVEAPSWASDELLSDSYWETERPTDHTWNLQQTHLYLALRPGSATQHNHYTNSNDNNNDNSSVFAEHNF